MQAFLGHLGKRSARVRDLSRWATALSLLALLTVILPSAARGEDDDLPMVNLADFVPARWLTDGEASMPLKPERWRKKVPPQCRTRGGYRQFCQGPRAVARPYGEAQKLAERLDLGHRAVALWLRARPAAAPWLRAVKGYDTERGLDFPVPDGHMGRGFGRTRDAALRHRKHLGVDIGAPAGSPIVAVRGGLVVYSDNGITGYGNAVMLLHEDDSTTFYAHCRSTFVFAGQRVQRGEVIAEVGKTGFAPAPHLHFELRRRGVPRDPEPMFRKRKNDLRRAEREAARVVRDAGKARASAQGGDTDG